MNKGETGYRVELVIDPANPGLFKVNVECVDPDRQLGCFPPRSCRFTLEQALEWARLNVAQLESESEAEIKRLEAEINAFCRTVKRA